MISAQAWTAFVVAGSTAVAVAVGWAGPASATESDFLYDLNNSGIGGPTDQLLALGAVACSDKHTGVPRVDSLSNIQNRSDLGSYDAGFLYDSASMFLCP